MHRGNCVANNSQLRNMDLVGEENGLQCLYVGLEQSMIEAEDESGTGIWLYPAGDSVKCYTSRDSSDPFECTEITNSNGSSGVTLYRMEGRFIGNKVGEYTCCLPGSCDSATGEHVTVKIFGELLSEHAPSANLFTLQQLHVTMTRISAYLQKRRTSPIFMRRCLRTSPWLLNRTLFTASTTILPLRLQLFNTTWRGP